MRMPTDTFLLLQKKTRVAKATTTEKKLCGISVCIFSYLVIFMLRRTRSDEVISFYVLFFLY